MAYDFKSLTKQTDEASNRGKFYTDFEDVDPNVLHQISDLTEWIRTKGKGSDVREVIAQLFERTWLEGTKEGNANMEVAKARGEFENLADRLENILSEAQQGKIPMDRLAQDVKEAMTGGSVAVVGKNAVQTENIVNRSVDWSKTDFIEPSEQLFDISHPDDESDRLLIDAGRTVNTTGYFTTHAIFAVGQVTANYVRAYVLYSGNGSVAQYQNTNNNLATVTINLLAGQYVRFSLSSGYKNQIMVNRGSILLPLKPFELKLKDDIKIGAANDTDHIGQIIAQLGNQLFDKNKISKDKLLLETDGRSISMSNYFVSEGIQMTQTEKVTLSNIRVYVLKDYLGRYKTGANTGNNSAVITIDVAKDDILQISGHTSMLENVMVNFGSTALPVEQYMYVLKDDFYIPKSRIIDDIPDTKNKPFEVSRSGNTILITSKRDENTLVQKIILNNSKNGTLNVRETTLNGTIIHNLTDDITPIRLESTVGANHGYTMEVLPTEFHAQLVNDNLYPSVKNIKQDVEIKDDRLKITETYDVLDLPSIIANGPSYKDNLAAVESAVRIITSYEFYGFGQSKVSTTLLFLKEKRITTLGFLQSVPTEGNVVRYLPGIKPFNGFDFSSGVTLNDYNMSYNVELKDLINSNQPPLFYRDSTDLIDYSMGYLPVESASDTNRLEQSSIFWDLRDTKKSYPVCLNWQSNPIKTESIYQLTGFRNYALKSSDTILAQSINYGSERYIYLHSVAANGLTSKEIESAIGSTFEIIRNSGFDFKVNTVGPAGLIFSNTQNAYAVLRVTNG